MRNESTREQKAARQKELQQFRTIRHELFTKGTALLFTANAAVAAAIVQWVLRDKTASATTFEHAIDLIALLAAALHATGASVAVNLPRIRIAQYFRDLQRGRIQSPLEAPPLKEMGRSGRLFIGGVLILGVGLILRELNGLAQ